MADYPVPVWPVLNVITPYHADSIGAASRGASVTALSGAASIAMTANLAWFYPFRLWQPIGAYKMSVIVGATNTGNVDVGIYDAGWNRLVRIGTGTALGTANTLQEIDIADTALAVGLYFMAIQLSDSAGTVFGAVKSDESVLPLLPIYEQAVGSAGLPNPAVPVVSATASPLVVAMGVHAIALI